MESSEQFYLYLNGTRRGPFSENQMRVFLNEGLLQSTDLICDQASSDWKPIASVPRFTQTSAPSPPPSIPPPAIAQVEQSQLPPASLGPYARATLAPNETPFFKTSLHWIIFVRFAFAAFFAVVLLALPFAIALQALTGSQLGWFALPLPAFLMVPPTLAWVSSELVITDRRVLIKTGIIRRQTLEMFIPKVESIAIDQGFLGRICDYGTVLIRGTGGFEEPFEAIAHPIQFRNWVQRLQHSGEVNMPRGN